MDMPTARSDRLPGKYSTAGYFERYDIGQVIDQVRAQRPEQTRQVVLFGASLGAAVAAATAALRDDLLAVLLESPFADYSHAIEHPADRIGLPGKFFQKMALRTAQWMAGGDFSVVRPVDAIPQILCPVMAICYHGDPFVPPDDLAALRLAMQKDANEVWEIEGAHHLMGLAENPDEYEKRVADFFQRVARIIQSSAQL
jgi:pimeloyl-ACP methyl ester carboxylesterase